LDLFKYFILLVLLSFGYAQAYVFENFENDKVDSSLSYDSKIWQWTYENSNNLLVAKQSGIITIDLCLDEVSYVSFDFFYSDGVYQLLINGTEQKYQPQIKLFPGNNKIEIIYINYQPESVNSKAKFDNFICTPVKTPDLIQSQKANAVRTVVSFKPDNPLDRVYYSKSNIRLPDTLSASKYVSPLILSESGIYSFFSNRQGVNSVLETIRINRPESISGYNSPFNPVELENEYAYLHIYMDAANFSIQNEFNKQGEVKQDYYLGYTKWIWNIGCSFKPGIIIDDTSFGIYSGLGLGQFLQFQLGYIMNKSVELDNITAFRINASYPLAPKTVYFNLPFIISIDGKYECNKTNLHLFGVGLGFIFGINNLGK